MEKIGKISLLEKHLDKLPNTKEYLQIYVESITDFQNKRLKGAIDELEKEVEEVKEWKVMRKAGINDKYSSKISKYIQNLIFTLEEYN
ncbi:hypothetical protein [Clostridium sp.]|uniref:hypothetical protein n=1 Tax=Clostridium sp. TaxID=1506 RepID=UPI002FC65585